MRSKIFKGKMFNVKLHYFSPQKAGKAKLSCDRKTSGSLCFLWICGCCTINCLIVLLFGIFVAFTWNIRGSWSQGFFRSNIHLGPVVMRNSLPGLFLPTNSGIFSSNPQAMREETKSRNKTRHYASASSQYIVQVAQFVKRCNDLLSGLWHNGHINLT